MKIIKAMGNRIIDFIGMILFVLLIGLLGKYMREDDE